jgi:hypothetical protein
MKTSEDPRYAYLAGILDGEGSICISKTTPKGLAKSPWFAGSISVGMTSKQVVKTFKDKFGGSFSTSKPNGLGDKRIYRWMVISQNARLVAKTLLPFLKIKKRQASLLIKFINFMDKNGRHGSRPNTLTETALRESFRKRMQKLNA